jgi:RNA polymerase-binding transcription factor DksA
VSETICWPVDYQLVLKQTIRLRLAELRAQGRLWDIPELEQALQRLHRSDFGACEGCGALISFARISADPVARRCGRCASAG